MLSFLFTFTLCEKDIFVFTTSVFSFFQCESKGFFSKVNKGFSPLWIEFTAVHKILNLSKLRIMASDNKLNPLLNHKILDPPIWKY